MLIKLSFNGKSFFRRLFRKCNQQILPNRSFSITDNAINKKTDKIRKKIKQPIRKNGNQPKNGINQDENNKLHLKNFHKDTAISIL